MKIYLNEAQSKILLDIAVKDLLPKELEKRRKELQLKRKPASQCEGETLKDK
jgi:hypothetical protein